MKEHKGKLVLTSLLVLLPLVAGLLLWNRLPAQLPMQKPSTRNWTLELEPTAASASAPSRRPTIIASTML